MTLGVFSVPHYLGISPSKIAQNIEVEDIPPTIVVNIGLQGDSSYQSFQKNLKRLTD